MDYDMDKRINFPDEIFLSAGIEHQSIDVVCTAINSFGSSKSSLLLTVQTENKLTEKEVNAVGSEKVSGVDTRDSPRYPGNSRQPAAGMEKLVGGDGENIQLREEEIFWIPFHTNSNEKINQAEENLDDNLNRVKGKGDAFEKAEQADQVKALYQGENFAGHETKTEIFDKKENLIKKDTFDIKFNSSSAHAPTFYFFVIFMQSALYFFL